MSGFASSPDISLNQWLAEQHRNMVTDLAATIDLEAGLREATIPVRHTNLVADLGGVLDVEAGLSAIVPTAPNLTPHELTISLHAADAELLAPRDRFETGELAHDFYRALAWPSRSVHRGRPPEERSDDDSAATPGQRHHRWIAAMAAAIALVITFSVTLFHANTGDPLTVHNVGGQISLPPTNTDGGNGQDSTAALRPLIPGDDYGSGSYIGAVTSTFQDLVRVKEQFTKTWTIRNAGTAIWQDRYLTRQTPQDPGQCSSPSRIPVPITQPGENVQISVTLTAPDLPGSCRVNWKMTDANGHDFFPNIGALSLFVYVIQ